jgi:aspartate/methionine/tyrosine aminotransferase
VCISCSTEAIAHSTEARIPAAKAWALSFKPTPARPLLDLSQGVPGVPPPPALLHALADAASNDKWCGYGPVPGETEMRDALALEMKWVYGQDADITSEDVALTAGCNMAFVAVLMALASHGDEVILPIPWYVRGSIEC